MSNQVIQALRLTQMENDLLDIRREIKKYEGVINSPNCSAKFKKDCRKRLVNLVKQRDALIDRITEAALL